MIVAGIIPARYASTRLPGKPLLLIHGKPMIQRVYEQTKKSGLINSVIVATDDKRIYHCVKNFGGEVMMTSKKHQSGTDRLSEVAEKIKCDIVVNIQGDEPYIDPRNIDLAIEPLIKDRNLDVSTLAIKIKEVNDLKDANKVKVVIDKNNFALYFSRNCIPFDMLEMVNMEQKSSKNFVLGKKIFYKHIGMYVYRKNYLLKFANMKMGYLEKMEKLEQLRILENGDKIKVMLTRKDSVSVDSAEDLKKLNSK